MSFYEKWQAIDQTALSLHINSKTAVDVEAALAKTHLDLEDFYALI